MGCYIWYSEEGTGRGRSPPRPLLAVPNATAHPSVASVPITVLLYNGPLLCGLHVPIKGLRVPVCHCIGSPWQRVLNLNLTLMLTLILIITNSAVHQQTCHRKIYKHFRCLTFYFTTKQHIFNFLSEINVFNKL